MNHESGALKVALITQGRNVPSTRFRVGQHAPDLQAHGIASTSLDARFGAYAPIRKAARPIWLSAAVTESLSRVLRSWRYDVCFLQRNLVATLCTWEPLLRRPLVFDVDDAIFLGPRGASADRIARRASITICGNQFLADYFSRLGPVEVLPTAVDTDRFTPSQGTPQSRAVLGWSGSSSGFSYLYSIEPALLRLLERHREAMVKVVADRPPAFNRLPSDRVVFERWHPETEVAALHDFTVGLMPLADSPWARGKCSFKMLTYMAVGIPVVVSPVGMNKEVLAHGKCGFAASTSDEWVDAMSALIADRDASTEMGQIGRRIAVEHYSRHAIGPRLAQILKGAA
jgi:glycosyltransferase involved in cell wall biosynthesis